MHIAEWNNVVLRPASAADMALIDQITIICYTPIAESYIEMLGRACYEVVKHDPELTWQERKTGQVHRLFEQHPEWLWVLDKEGLVFGFIMFYLIPEQGYGHIDNNGVHPDYARQGWGKFMVQHVLDHFRRQGLRYAHVDTGLDPAHVPARRTYEAVGFDRQVPTVEYWQDLTQNNPGSRPE